MPCSIRNLFYSRGCRTHVRKIKRYNLDNYMYIWIFYSIISWNRIFLFDNNFSANCTRGYTEYARNLLPFSRGCREIPRRNCFGTMWLAFCFASATKILANDSEKMLFFLSLPFWRWFPLREFPLVAKLSRRHVHACICERFFEHF